MPTDIDKCLYVSKLSCQIFLAYLDLSIFVFNFINIETKLCIY